MYEGYWGLAEKPFENTPDPRFLYHSRQHEEALMRLVYVVREAKGAGMLSGVFGCEKQF
jgi:general secretion pathway protein A